MTSVWPLTQHCLLLWSGVLPTKFGGHRAFLINLISSWPRMTPAWPLTPAMHYALVRDSSDQMINSGGLRAFVSSLTYGWSRLTPAWPLTPTMYFILIRGSSRLSLSRLELDLISSLDLVFGVITHSTPGASPLRLQTRTFALALLWNMGEPTLLLKENVVWHRWSSLYRPQKKKKKKEEEEEEERRKKKDSIGLLGHFFL